MFLGSRDESRGSEAVSDVLREIGPAYNDRIELMIGFDVNNTESVNVTAAVNFSARFGSLVSLFGIVNNAEIGFGRTVPECVSTNTLGPKRTFDAFSPFLQPQGRIVNVSSASGPNYVSKLPPTEQAYFIGKLLYYITKF